MTVTRSRCVAMVVFLSIAALVAGGLAWATAQALQLEREAQQLKHADLVRLALWRLDSRIFPVLAREDKEKDKDKKIRMNVKAQHAGEITYSTIPDKFFPILTRYQTDKDKDRLIYAVMVKLIPAKDEKAK